MPTNPSDLAYVPFVSVDAMMRLVHHAAQSGHCG